MVLRVGLSYTKELSVCLHQKTKKVEVIFSRYLSDKPTPMLHLDTLSWNSLRSLVPRVNKYFESDKPEYYLELINPMRNLYIGSSFFANTKLIDIRVQIQGRFTKIGMSLSRSAWELFISHLKEIDDHIFHLHCVKPLLIPIQKLVAKELMKSTINFCGGCRDGQPNQLGHDCLLDDWYGEEGRFESIKKSIIQSNVDSLDRTDVLYKISQINDSCFPPDKLLSYVLRGDLLTLCSQELFLNPKQEFYIATCYNEDT